jgi:hypothetical protein
VCVDVVLVCYAALPHRVKHICLWPLVVPNPDHPHSVTYTADVVNLGLYAASRFSAAAPQPQVLVHLNVPVGRHSVHLSLQGCVSALNVQPQ